MSSSNAQVIFVSETRNSCISESAIKNHCNVDDVHIVLAQGQSGDMWLLVKHEVEANVLAINRNFFLALCNHKKCSRNFGLVCLYGDPHHQ